VHLHPLHPGLYVYAPAAALKKLRRALNGLDPAGDESGTTSSDDKFRSYDIRFHKF